MKTRIEAITHNKDVSVDDRIDLVFALREELSSKVDTVNLSNDVACFTALIDMIIYEDDAHAYDRELLQLYVLLGEAYVELEDYRKLKDVARGTLDVIRYEVTAWDAMSDTLPRIIDAVGESVYNHDLYELLLHYIRVAFHAGELDDELTGRVRKMLKLRILLDDNYWLDRLWNKELQSAIANLFTRDELLKIIMHPHIGHLRRDPVEYTWEWENIYYDVEDKLNYRFANAPRQMGFCFQYWEAKRELLENEYGIKWRSPSLMNPGVMFD